MNSMEIIYKYINSKGNMLYPSSVVDRCEMIKEITGANLIKVLKYGYQDKDGYEYIINEYHFNYEGKI